MQISIINIFLFFCCTFIILFCFIDANDCDDDEYVFKDGKNHHHGKRHAHHKNKGHKRSRMDDSVVDEIKSHTVVSSDENRNSSVQNDHLEPAPRLKVP